MASAETPAARSPAPTAAHAAPTQAEVKHEPPASRKVWWVAGGVVGGVVLIIVIILLLPNSGGDTSDSNVVAGAVVDILCDTGEGGSGTIFTADGTILTNNHVIASATKCEITIPDPATGKIKEVYEASPIILPTLSKKYDVATLKIYDSYTDDDGKVWGTWPKTFTPFTLPSSCDPTAPSKLGDSVKIYGYPVTSGGYNLTLTTGVISSFANDGEILTSTQIDSGNSGGLAVDQNGCWLGIPSAVVSGNYQNLGVIIPGIIIETYFLNNVPAKTDPAIGDLNDTKNSVNGSSGDDSSDPSPKSNIARCQDNYGSHSEWSGKLNNDGDPTCGCQAGYSWSASGESCVTKTSLLQSCQADHGYGSYSYPRGGKATCGCSDGYSWNAAGTVCVADTPSCTANATYDYSQSSCVCDSGYFLQNGSCVTGYSYCQNKNGYGSTYNYSDNTCGCQAGYILAGGSCQYGNTYCSIRWGVGAEYDSSQDSCVCGYGYHTSGSSCVSDYSY